MQDTVGAGDWQQFKKQLYKLYPGSTGEQKYTIADLKALVEKWAADPMETSAFISANCLISQKQITLIQKKN